MFFSFAKNMVKSLSNKYGQKLLDSVKKSTTDAIKTASKRAIQKTAGATGDLICKKIPVKTASVLKNSTKKLENDSTIMKQKPQKKDTYLQKKESKLLS